jgi:hypothetical protein
MTSVAQSGLVFLGLDVSKNAISVGVLPAESDAVAVDRIFSDEESVRRLIGRFPDSHPRPPPPQRGGSHLIGVKAVRPRAHALRALRDDPRDAATVKHGRGTDT